MTDEQLWEAVREPAMRSSVRFLLGSPALKEVLQAAIDAATAELAARIERMIDERESVSAVVIGFKRKNDELRAERDALAADAARYRWLRNEADFLRAKEGSPQVCLTNEWGEIISTGKDAYPQREQLDAAIDAMKEQ